MYYRRNYNFLFLLKVFDHLLKELFVLFKVSLQVLNVFVFIVYGSLQTSHRKHELLHLKTQLVKFYL